MENTDNRDSDAKVAYHNLHAIAKGLDKTGLMRAQVVQYGTPPPHPAAKAIAWGRDGKGRIFFLLIWPKEAEPEAEKGALAIDSIDR